MAYYPKLKVIGQLNKQLQHFLYEDEVVKLSMPPPIVSYRSARKISAYSVRAKLYLENV